MKTFYIVKRFKIEAENKERAAEAAESIEGKTLQIWEPPQPQARSIPYDQWPIWAKALRQFAKPEDKGIGDVVARMIGEDTSEAFKAWHLATFGKPCNCKGRQARWNKLYPLNQ